MKDDETRREEYRKRRQKVFWMRLALLAGFILLIIFLIIKNSKTYSGMNLDMTSYLKVHYQGYDGVAKAQLQFDRQAFEVTVDKVKSEYLSSIWPLKKSATADDFDAFKKSVSANLSRDSELKNGDEVSIVVDYDRQLADLLKMSMKYEDIPFTVADLAEGIEIDSDAIFSDLTISVNGISPMITLEVINESKTEPVNTFTYEVTPAKDFYERGDWVTIKAVYDKEAMVAAHYAIPDGADEMKYMIPGDKSYVKYADDLDEASIDKAIELAQKCLLESNANEYGLRIFTDAHLPYAWEGTGDYTFEWSNARLLSGYVETLKDEYMGVVSKPYNYLELAFEVHISQANGVGCDAEAVVCFDGMTVDDEGNVDLNEDSVQVFAASYSDTEIKRTIRGWFGDEYSINRVDVYEWMLENQGEN
ncbi:MAG: hypothetical protein IKR56_08255 [Lachnospiraceae bacterium]|nr:hypothetical protein [Lachnospiraceae bacterium]